jgi:hypothetical protein
MAVEATSSERQDAGANNHSLTDQNPGNVVAIGETNANAPEGTSSARQDAGANNHSLTDQNPGNVIEI